MGEIKSVKVDNWGVFFLQKLQNFFNKTDYCDLTLQFDDNSQLKVHRLVLSACTDYFNVLENTYDVSDDILIMPRELQADVVVPIVNFMYTGTLEFEISMYGRLLKTAKDMNMTVLLKLLEAHKRTVEGTRGPNVPRTPPKTTYNTQKKSAPVVRAIRPVERTYSSSAGTSSSMQHHHANLQQQLQQQRRVQVQPKITQYKNIQIKTVNPIITSGYRKTLPEPAAIVAKYSHNQTTVKGPSRFECADETILPPDSFESSFDNISYESKPLITANQICKEERDLEDYDQYIPAHKTLNQSSPFEQLRRSYTNSSNKRPPSISAIGSPPEKKPNIQDVKEYAEQQRMRKQIAAEYDDDHEYDDVLDDEFHNDDDDEDYVPPAHIQKQQPKGAVQRPIVITQDSDRKSTIVLKNSGPDTDHAKIISEVLKKYPHLVKKPDNVKFQITSKYGKTTTQKLVIKEEPTVVYKAEKKPVAVPVVAKPKPAPEPVPQPSTSKAAIAAAAAAATATTVATPAAIPSTSTQPKRIDSKTMHALIALGAENTTGPWLCLRCGVNGRPISIPSYRGFRRHLINTHKEKIDPRLCEHCGWRSRDTRELLHHMLVKHSIKPPANFQFPSCEFCSEVLLNEDALVQHMEVSHPEYKETFNQCMYCNKAFENETLMYNHVRSKHKIQAQEDGVIEYSDNDDSMDSSKFVSKQTKQQHPGGEGSNEKIKILSDISIGQTLPLIETATVLTGNEITIAPSSEAESLNTVATGIATSLGLVDNAAVIDDSQILSTEYINAEMEAIHSDFDKKVTKFMTSDGSVMELTDAQRDEIISQLDDQHNSGVVMVLNQDTFEADDSAAGNTEATSQAFGNGDDSMFIVYSQSGETEKIKNAKDSKVAAEKRNTNEEASTSQIDWQDAAVSEIFEGNPSEVAKKEDSSADENEAETDEMCVLNDSEDNIEKVIREMDQGYATEKPASKLEEPEAKSSSTSTKGQSKDDDAKQNKLKLLTVDWTDDEEDDSDLKDESMKSEEAESNAKQTSSKNPDSTELLYEITTNAVSEKEVSQKKVSPTHDATSSDKCFSEEATESASNRTDKRSSSQEDDEQDLPKISTKVTEKQRSVEEQIPDEDQPESNKEKTTSEKDESEVNDEEKEETEVSEAEKKPVKPEISNLISDWGDEDEEEI